MARPDPQPARHRGRRGSTVAGALLALIVLIVLVAGAACSRDPERSVAAYCEQVTNVASLDETLDLGDVARINSQLAELRKLEQVAPPEIQPKVATIVSVTDELARTIPTAKDANAAATKVFTKPQAEIDAITGAGRDVVVYTRDTCKIELDGTTAPGSAVPNTGSVPGTTPR